MVKGENRGENALSLSAPKHQILILPETLTRYSQWFVLVTAVFITCVITANILAVKLVNVFRLALPESVILFPIGFIFGDVSTGVYGHRQAARVIWLGSFCNLIAVVAIWGRN